MKVLCFHHRDWIRGLQGDGAKHRLHLKYGRNGRKKLSQLDFMVLSTVFYSFFSSQRGDALLAVDNKTRRQVLAKAEMCKVETLPGLLLPHFRDRERHCCIDTRIIIFKNCLFFGDVFEESVILVFLFKGTQWRTLSDRGDIHECVGLKIFLWKKKNLTPYN